MTRYENQELGIYFNYPIDWIVIQNCKSIYGVDTLIHNDNQTFGILRVSKKLNDTLINNPEQIKNALESTVQKSEVIVSSPQLNKYIIDKSNSATITLRKMANPEIRFQERTLIINHDQNQCFIVAFEDLFKNYENGFSQSTLNKIFESLKFSI